MRFELLHRDYMFYCAPLLLYKDVSVCLLVGFFLYLPRVLLAMLVVTKRGVKDAKLGETPLILIFIMMI